MKKNLLLGALLAFLLLVVAGSYALAQSSINTRVTREKFAELLAQELKLPKASDQKCFKDVSKKNPNAPSICALKKAKILLGAKTASFSPTKPVNFQFAINTLCRSGKWVKKKTYAACAAAGKQRGIKTMRRQELLSAAQVAEFIKKAHARGVSPPPPPPSTKDSQKEPIPEEPKALTLPPLETHPLAFTPYPERTIPTDFFNNIILQNPLPNRFYLNEVYFVEGDIIGTASDEAFVFLCRDGQGCDDSTNFIEKTEGNHFKIGVRFQEVGNFQIGIISGRSGESLVEDISVVPGSPSEIGASQPPTDLTVTYEKGNTRFRWKGSASLTRFVIFQGEKRRDYIFRQPITSYAPPSEDFAKFTKGKAGWLVSSDSTSSTPQEIILTVKDFRKIESDKIRILKLDEVLEKPGTFVFNGKALEPLAKKVAVTLPNGSVREFDIAENDIPAQSEFTVETEFATTGTYIFEVNTPDGNAVVNVPIYVGGEIPLLPDFFALNTPELDPSPLTDLSSARKRLLALVNKDRTDHGLSAVILSDELNAVAQRHSEDMVTRNFFSHVNPSGLSPDDRRKNAGVSTAIRENLGKSATLANVQAGLMRSPLHRAAILDPEMTRVGLGIAKNSEGYFLVTQNFSADPVLASDLPQIEERMFETSNRQRTTLSLPQITHDATLRQTASEWSGKMAAEGFFSGTDGQGNTLVDLLRSKGIRSAIRVYFMKTTDVKQFEEEITRQEALKDATMSKIGIGLGLGSLGELFMTVIYTP